MPDTTRTFIAVAIPEALDPKLFRLQEKLAADVPEMRWQTPRPFHVTLAFLGDVPHADLNAVCLAVADAAAGFDPFELWLDLPGAFPKPERPRVVWAGVSTPQLENLHELQAAVAGALAKLNYPPESRPFHAHVTLGRSGHGRRPVPDLTPILQKHRRWHAGPFHVTEAITFGSNPTREGPVYTPLGRAPLLGRKPDTST